MNTNILKANPSDTESASVSAYPEMTAEEEYFLYELETSDSSSVGLVLRAIYDSGNVDKFSRALERRITHYDKNISKVCGFHYQGFLDAIKDLPNLGVKCGRVKELARDVNACLQAEGDELMRIGRDAERCRKIQRNANVAVEQIAFCLPILDNFVNAQQLMTQKKYLQALKVVEELEHSYLPHIHKYRFTQSLSKAIEPMRKQIRESSYSELTDFLEDIQKVSGRVGKEACKEAAVQLIPQFGSNKEASSKNEQKTEIGMDGSIVQITPRLEVQTVVLEDEKQVRAQDRIDYATVHRCCQVFGVLGERESFEKYYREQRREQVLVTASSKVTQCVETCIRYLNDIVGFFVVEDRIMQMQPTLVTAAHKDQLWEMCLQKVTVAMNNQFGNCVDVKTMLHMKRVILIFALTMKSYGYNVAQVYLLLQRFRDQYNEILMKEYCVEFDAAMSTDNYSPLIIRSQKECPEWMVEFPDYRRAIGNDAFPRSYTFSSFVPKIYYQAQQYVKGCLSFMDGLQMSSTEMDDTVRRYANVLLHRWSGSLKLFISSRNRSLVELVQVTINMGYLESSCEYLERYISRLTVRDSLGSQSTGLLVALNGKVFEDVRYDAEQLIDERLRQKVDDIFELAKYDWDLSSSSGVASEYITDLIRFMETTFTSFTTLPEALSRHSCTQICKYLADRLHSAILSSEFKTISPGALEQFNLDVMQCELFAARCPVMGCDDSALSLAFAHVRQLLDLVMNNDWNVFIADRGTQSKYLRVKTADAAVILEKIIEYEKKSSSFFGGGKSQDRKRLYETILRQLRSINN